MTTDVTITEFFAMGSDCSLYLCGEPPLVKTAADAAIAEVRRIEARYSRYREDSVLSEINRVAAKGGTIEVDRETAHLLNYAFALYHMSGGLFDITSGILRKAWKFSSARIPEQCEIDALLARIGLFKTVWKFPRLTFLVEGMEIDFGGIGKEYAADRAAEACVAAGVRAGVVELGGDIRVVGPHPNGLPWSMGIRSPHGDGGFMAVAHMSQGAIATSGSYVNRIETGGRRYTHILNPKTGWPIAGVCSVSVLADRCIDAGSVTTIAMLKEGESIDWLESSGLSYVCMDDEGNVGSSDPAEVINPVGVIELVVPENCNAAAAQRSPLQ